MKSHLQVKVFSMAAEMTYIRHQEEKWKNRARHARAKQYAAEKDKAEKAQASLQYAEQNFWSHRWHREGLKFEARHSHLAYGFMKGRSYQQMENICYGDVKGFGSYPPNWGRIEEIIIKFSKDEPDVQGIMQRFGEWLADAKIWYDANPMRIAVAMTARDDKRQRLLADADYQKERAKFHAEAESIGRQDADNGWIKRDGKWRCSVKKSA